MTADLIVLVAPADDREAHDFSHAREVFSWPSDQYILHGMHFRTQHAELADVAREAADARRLLALLPS